uniref:mucin-2-like n=1 Tax=Doryrhamphus excisus TaxID=161450 RepID=UPI0025ADFDEA|nr:mucin-2-like [Doryrhamphus excisus]
MMLLSLKTFWVLLWGLASVAGALTTMDTEKLRVPKQEASTLPADLFVDDEPATRRADGLMVTSTLTVMAKLRPTFSDSPETADRTSHDGTTEGTKPTEGQQPFTSSPATMTISEMERNSTPVFIQHHSGPGTTGRTSAELTSTLQTTEPLMSVSSSMRSFQNLSSPASFGTTGRTSLGPSISSSISSGSTQNLNRTTERMSTASDSPEPSTSSSITESSASSPSNSGLTSKPQPPSRFFSSSSSTRIPATTRSPPSSPPPCVPVKPSEEDQLCSTRSVVKPCLIAIAFLAALATIFMVSTIVLCTKLSTRTYHVERAKEEETEMMFMSALLPERNYASLRQRSPAVTNGVLVLHGVGDSDEDVSDNLTLSSFLPESDRFV